MGEREGNESTVKKKDDQSPISDRFQSGEFVGRRGHFKKRNGTSKKE